MQNKRQAEQLRRFREVWDSLEPEIIGDLERLCFRLNVIYNESQLNGVRNHVIDREMQERFWALWREIGKETERREAV